MTDMLSGDALKQAAQKCAVALQAKIAAQRLRKIACTVSLVVYPSSHVLTEVRSSSLRSTDAPRFSAPLTSIPSGPLPSPTSLPLIRNSVGGSGLRITNEMIDSRSASRHGCTWRSRLRSKTSRVFPG